MQVLFRAHKCAFVRKKRQNLVLEGLHEFINADNRIKKENIQNNLSLKSKDLLSLV